MFRFEQTRLGFFLKYECPALYEVLWRMFGHGDSFCPKAGLIELVCSYSNDPSIKKLKFKRYLNEYRKTGLCCRKGQKMTAKRAKYYARIRKRKLDKYILGNGRRIVEKMEF